MIILVFDSIIVIEIGGNLFLLKNVQHYNIRFGKLWKCVYVSECLATLICVLRRKKKAFTCTLYVVNDIKGWCSVQHRNEGQILLITGAGDFKQKRKKIELMNFFFSRLKIPYNLNSVFAIEFRYDKMRSSEKHQSIGEEFFNNNEIGKLHLSRCLLKSWNKTHLEIYGVCLVLLVHSILYVLVSYSHISAHPSFQK